MFFYGWYQIIPASVISVGQFVLSIACSQFLCKVPCFFLCLIVFDYVLDIVYEKALLRHNLRPSMAVCSFKKDIASFQTCSLLLGEQRHYKDGSTLIQIQGLSSRDY